MNWMLMPLRRYADFSGRSRRREYWMFVLFVCMVLFGGIGLAIALGAASGAFDSPNDSPVAGLMMIPILLLGIFYLAILVPGLAVQVRRFHDQDKSGWFVLMNFIPYIGGIIVLVFMCMEGTRGPNRYGEDPKAENTAQIFA